MNWIYVMITFSDINNFIDLLIMILIQLILIIIKFIDWDLGWWIGSGCGNEQVDVFIACLFSVTSAMLETIVVCLLHWVVN